MNSKTMSFCSMHYARSKVGSDMHRPSIRYKRPAIIEGDIVKIPLGVAAKDGYALVDLEFAWLERYSWTKNNYGYAVTRINKKWAGMHRLVVGIDNCIGRDVDHKNMNKLDNKSINLRISTRSENMSNTTKKVTNSSGYKGVEKINKRWRARITKNYRVYHGGYYATPQAAAIAYNALALKHHGRFAFLNKVDS